MWKAAETFRGEMVVGAGRERERMRDVIEVVGRGGGR